MLTMAQKKAALDRITEANGGILTPEAVVQAAKNPKHVLYEIFPWNDAIAAHQRRLDIARHLIASVEVIIEYEDITTSAVSYIHDVRQGRRGQGYVSIDALAKRKEDALQSVLLELERVVAGIERARGIAASLGLASYFENLLQAAIAAKIRVQKKRKAA